MSELQSCMSIVQYLGKFIPNLSEVTAPLRKLLEKDIYGTGTQISVKVLKSLYS